MPKKPDSSRQQHRPDDLLEREVALHYEALGYQVTRNVNVLNHQIDLVARKYIPGSNMVTLMIEVKHRSAHQVGINDVTHFINTARHLMNEMKITGAVLVADTNFSQDANGAVLPHPAIRLITLDALEKEILDDAEAVLRVCKDYELRPIFQDYIPLSGIFDRRGTRLQKASSSDLVRDIKDWAKKEHSFLVLLGDFGSGKSTILERIFYEFYKERYCGLKTILPVFLRLRSLLHHHDLWSFIASSLRDQQYMNLSKQVFDAQLKDGRLFLLLDGFDEIHTGANADDRAYYLAKLAPLIASPSPCVLSTRPTYFESFDKMISSMEKQLEKPLKFNRISNGGVDLERFMSRLELGTQERMKKSDFLNVVAISQLDRNSIISYLLKYEAALLKKTGRTVEEIARFLYRTYDLEDLMRRPLLLKMIVETILEGDVDVNDIDAEVGPSTLYELYTQTSIVRDIKKAHTNQFLKLEERLLVCRHLAFEMLEKQSIVLKAPDVTRAIETARLPSILSAKGRLEDALERAETDVRVCSFLQLDDDGSLRFAHKSYYEFFLAQSCYLDAVDDPRKLRKYAK
jgi:hypothetical protein